VTALLVGPFPKPTRDTCFHQSAANVPDPDYGALLEEAASQSTGGKAEDNKIEAAAVNTDISKDTFSGTGGQEAVAASTSSESATKDGRSVMRVGVLTISDRVGPL
jgi:hypothetical protein